MLLDAGNDAAADKASSSPVDSIEPGACCGLLAARSESEGVNGAPAASGRSKVARAQLELQQLQKALGEKAEAKKRASEMASGDGGKCGSSGCGETNPRIVRTVERNRRRLYIGNLPLELNEADVHKVQSYIFHP